MIVFEFAHCFTLLCLIGDAAIKAGVKGITPGTLDPDFVPKITVDGSKAARVLGLQYRSKYETGVDAIKSIFEIVPGAAPSGDH